jgi:hypothetical protein
MDIKAHPLIKMGKHKNVHKWSLTMDLNKLIAIYELKLINFIK